MARTHQIESIRRAATGRDHFGFIGKRLREIEQERRRAFQNTADACGAAAVEPKRPPVDFAAWFGQMVRSV